MARASGAWDVSLPVAHLTADMLRVDTPGHEAHAVVRIDWGSTRNGTRSEVTCSCGTRFELSKEARKRC